MSPAITSPELRPIRNLQVNSVSGLHEPRRYWATCSWIPIAARRAGAPWSSYAIGAPKTAMMPSPVNFSTVPPYRFTTPGRERQVRPCSRATARTHGRRDVHRVHDVGEEDRHLLVLRAGFGIGQRCATPVAEPGVLQRFGATRAARGHGCHRF